MLPYIVRDIYQSVAEFNKAADASEHIARACLAELDVEKWQITTGTSFFLRDGEVLTML
jgi:hypothetical protein